MILTHFYFTLYIFKSDTLIHYYKLFNTSLTLFISILIFGIKNLVGLFNDIDVHQHVLAWDRSWYRVLSQS